MTVTDRIHAATSNLDQEPQRPHRQASARLAGVAYLLTIICGMFAEVYARAAVRVPGDAAATAARLIARELLYRFSILADLVMLASYVVVTALLYNTFKGAGRTLSQAAALFSMIGVALLSAGTGLLAAPLILLGHEGYLTALPDEQRQVLAYVTLRLHGEFYSYTGFFFGLYCLTIGWLVLRSRDLPVAIGWMMIFAGATFAVDTMLELVAPGVARQVPDVVLMISLLGEGTLAIWLTTFGVERSTIMNIKGRYDHASDLRP
jgi:hypothetical protein